MLELNNMKAKQSFGTKKYFLALCDADVVVLLLAYRLRIKV
jgi:hypothetical protein